jgi:hypothetical protein
MGNAPEIRAARAFPHDASATVRRVFHKTCG